MAPPGKLGLTAAVQELRRLVDDKEFLEGNLKKINKRIKELQEHEIPRLLDDAEIEKATVENAGTVYIRQKVYVQMTGVDPDDPTSLRPPFYDWASEHHPDLITEYIHPARLNSWAKDMLENGKPLPDNMIRATFVPTATLRRS